MDENLDESVEEPSTTSPVKASNVPLRKSQRSRLASSVQSATRQQAIRSASSPPPKLTLTPRNRVGDTRNVVPIVMRSEMGRLPQEATANQMIVDAPSQINDVKCEPNLTNQDAPPKRGRGRPPKRQIVPKLNEQKQSGESSRKKTNRKVEPREQSSSRLDAEKQSDREQPMPIALDSKKDKENANTNIHSCDYLPSSNKGVAREMATEARTRSPRAVHRSVSSHRMTRRSASTATFIPLLLTHHDHEEDLQETRRNRRRLKEEAADKLPELPNARDYMVITVGMLGLHDQRTMNADEAASNTNAVKSRMERAALEPRDADGGGKVERYTMCADVSKQVADSLGELFVASDMPQAPRGVRSADAGSSFLKGVSSMFSSTSKNDSLDLDSILGSQNGEKTSNAAGMGESSAAGTRTVGRSVPTTNMKPSQSGGISAGQAAQMAMQNLNERGEKLSIVVDATENLRNNAMNMAQRTSKVAEKCEKKNIGDEKREEDETNANKRKNDFDEYYDIADMLFGRPPGTTARLPLKTMEGTMDREKRIDIPREATSRQKSNVDNRRIAENRAGRVDAAHTKAIVAKRTDARHVEQTIGNDADELGDKNSLMATVLADAGDGGEHSTTKIIEIRNLSVEKPKELRKRVDVVGRVDEPKDVKACASKLKFSIEYLLG